MKRASTVVLLVALAAACSSGTVASPAVTSPAVSATPSATAAAVSRAAAARALDEAVAHALGTTGAFSHVVTFGNVGADLTQAGRYDAKAGRWQATFTTQDPDDGSTVTLTFIGTRSAFYVNSPGWTGALKDHYYRFQAADLAKVTQTTVDLSDGLPLQITVLAALEAVSAEPAGSGLTITAELPAAEAASLANLKSGLAKLKVDLEDLTGTVTVTVKLDARNHVVSLAMDQGALKGARGLPGGIATFATIISATVQYKDFGVPVTIRVPSSEEIAPSDS